MCVLLENSFSHLVCCSLKQLCSILPMEHTGQDSEANSSFLHELFSSRKCGGCPSIQQPWCWGLSFWRNRSSQLPLPWLAKHRSLGAHRQNSCLMKLTQEPTQCPPASRGHSGHGPKVPHKGWGKLRSQHTLLFSQIGTTVLSRAPLGLKFQTLLWRHRVHPRLWFSQGRAQSCLKFFHLFARLRCPHPWLLILEQFHGP